MQGFCDGRVVGGGPPFGVYLHGRRAVLFLDAVQKGALCVGHGEKQAAQRLVLEGLVQPMDAEVRRGVVAQEGVGDSQQGNVQVAAVVDVPVEVEVQAVGVVVGLFEQVARRRETQFLVGPEGQVLH